MVVTPTDLLWDYYRQFQDFYSHCLTFADKRVADWLLMSSPMYTIYLCIAYLLFVAIGPQIMAKRQPLESKVLLLVYNFSMVALNFYIFFELLTCALKSNYNWVCTPVDYSDDPLAVRECDMETGVLYLPLASQSLEFVTVIGVIAIAMAAALWWYYISKPIEFFDTIMFILRKKTRQVTFLHVYHHVTMPLLWWIGIKWVAGGQSFFGAMVNSSVHVVMYMYYGLAAMGPEMQKKLWWKKHITHYQLIQFLWGMIHCVVSLYVDCPFPKWMQYACICYAGSFFLLFSNFYIINYLNKPKKVEQNGKLKAH